MERTSETITSDEAVRLVKGFSSKGVEPQLSSRALSELLGVPEEQVVAQVRGYRMAKRKRVFVDPSGILSAAISFTLVVAFVLLGCLIRGARTVSVERAQPVQQDVGTMAAPSSDVEYVGPLTQKTDSGPTTVEDTPDIGSTSTQVRS